MHLVQLCRLKAVIDVFLRAPNDEKRNNNLCWFGHFNSCITMQDCILCDAVCPDLKY